MTLLPPLIGARTMFENDEAETLAASLESNVESLVDTIDDGDVIGAKGLLTSIEGIVKTLRTELDSLPTTADVGETEGG